MLVISPFFSKANVYRHSLDDGSDSLTRVKDTHVYSLLFTECDSDRSGWANVDHLILFIKKVLSDSSSSEVSLCADETDDSDGSVSFATSTCMEFTELITPGDVCPSL